jgi:hypothetical protein
VVPNGAPILRAGRLLCALRFNRDLPAESPLPRTDYRLTLVGCTLLIADQVNHPLTR